MEYLLDANVLITAQNNYYPLDQVPEFWEWLLYQADLGLIKIPTEIISEITSGHNKEDPLYQWIKAKENKEKLELQESVSTHALQTVVDQGYASDLSDIEIAQLGFDPFLIAYALEVPEERCIITAEVPKPSKRRQNRKIPDVCNTFSIEWHNPFWLNRTLGFKTRWREEP